MSASATAYYQERAARLSVETAQHGIETVPPPQYLDGLPTLLSSDGKGDGHPVHMLASPESMAVIIRFGTVLRQTRPFLEQAAQIHWPHAPLDPGAPNHYATINSKAENGLLNTYLRLDGHPTGKLSNIQIEAITPDETPTTGSRLRTAQTRKPAGGEVHADVEAYFWVSGVVTSGGGHKIASCVAVLALETYARHGTETALPAGEPPSTHVTVPRLMLRGIRSHSPRSPFADPAVAKARLTRPYHDPWNLSQRPELVIPTPQRQ
jgi:hypothetical protein